MAKRIKVPGKPPRGLSKAERVVKGADATFKGESRLANKRGEQLGMPDWLTDSYIETLAGLRDYSHLSDKAKRGQTKPSSTRKKRVKEGNPKFIGPRQLRSEIAEDLKARGRLKPRLENLDLKPLVTAGDKRSLNYGDLRKALTDYLIKTGKIPPF
jgi:hypothetical protein